VKYLSLGDTSVQKYALGFIWVQYHVSFCTISAIGFNAVGSSVLREVLLVGIGFKLLKKVHHKSFKSSFDIASITCASDMLLKSSVDLASSRAVSSMRYAIELYTQGFGKAAYLSDQGITITQ
jgi:hypothetical protein